MPVAAYYLHDPAAPRPNSPTRMGTNVLLECRGRLLLEQRWDWPSTAYLGLAF